MSKMLTIEDILLAPDLESKEVAVPEWGGTVKVKGMTKREQQQMRKSTTDPQTGQIDSDRLEAAMLAHCLADPVVTIEQAEQLMQKSATAVDRVLTAAMDVAGMSDTAQKAMSRTFHAGDERPEATS
ncbi:MAG: hypothetical protein KGZ56_01025 [Dethiobacter sp.]|nr:hypothetical protein [Dethiobacter sp.]MBS3898715.1 hypothetical protein [Dethiobacter sp.]